MAVVGVWWSSETVSCLDQSTRHSTPNMCTYVRTYTHTHTQNKHCRRIISINRSRGNRELSKSRAEFRAASVPFLPTLLDMTLPSFFLNKLIDFGVESFSSCSEWTVPHIRTHRSTVGVMHIRTCVDGTTHIQGALNKRLHTYVCMCALIGRLIHQGHHPLLRTYMHTTPTPPHTKRAHTYTGERETHLSNFPCPALVLLLVEPGCY